MVFTCCCYITWAFQQGEEKNRLPSLARLVFQIPGSPSWPAACASVINSPMLLKGMSEREKGRKMFMGLKSKEGACKGWAGSSQVSQPGRFGRQPCCSNLICEPQMLRGGGR